MAHQPGWIDLYGCLEEGGTPSNELVEQCQGTRTGIGETMLHWYAIEGEPDILIKLIDLGFSVNVQNEFGQTPVMEAALIGRWDNVRVLLDRGADLSLRNENGDDFFEYMEQYRKDVPAWVRR